jgi:hypothetical protein
LLAGRAPGLDAADTTAFWWMLFALAFVVAATASWVWGGQLAIYVVLKNLRALPPLIVGGRRAATCAATRCQRRASSVRARAARRTTVVDGVQFCQVAATFHEAIQRAERAARDAVGRRIARLENGVMWAAAMPFILLVVMPVSLALDGPHVELLWLPPALFTLGLALRAVGAFVRPRGPRGRPRRR